MFETQRRAKEEDPIIPFSDGPIISKWGAISRSSRTGYHTTDPIQATASQGSATKPISVSGTSSGFVWQEFILYTHHECFIPFVLTAAMKCEELKNVYIPQKSRGDSECCFNSFADYVPYVNAVDSRWSAYGSDSASSARYAERYGLLPELSSRISL